MRIDDQARQQIRAAIADSANRDLHRLIPLPGEQALLVLAHYGYIAFRLIDREDDLFDSTRDVTDLVVADLERDRALIDKAI